MDSFTEEDGVDEIVKKGNVSVFVSKYTKLLQCHDNG